MESADSRLNRLAEEAIMRETVRAAARASIAGPSGWRKQSRSLTLNKNFLTNTIKDAVSSNRRKDETLNSKSYSRKKLYEEKLREKRRKKHLFLSSRHFSDNDSINKSKKCVSSYDGEKNCAIIYQKEHKRKKNNSDSDIKSCDSDIIELDEDGSEMKNCKKNDKTKYLEWNEDEGLIMKPITKDYRKSKRMEEYINKARRKIRSKKFISEQHDTSKWEKTNPHREIQFRSQASSNSSKSGITFVPEDVAIMSAKEKVSKWIDFIPNSNEIQPLNSSISNLSEGCNSSDQSKNADEIQFISETQTIMESDEEIIAKWTKNVPNNHEIQFVSELDISS